MKSSLFRRLGVFMILVLAILIFSQGLWLSQQLKKEKEDFALKLESSLQSIINFHALEGFGNRNPKKPNTATLSLDRVPEEERNRDSSLELARYDISTKNYTRNFSLYKAMEATFTDLGLAKGKVKLKVVDSIFQYSFEDHTKINSYYMQLTKNGIVADTITHGKQKEVANNHESLTITIPLGTKEIYVFTANFQLRTFAFLRQMIYTISLSGLAVILVAVFMLWLLWALQQRAAQLQWREQSVRGIVHDLKSPLSYVYTLLDYITNKEQDVGIKQQLDSAGNNVSKLINKMELILTLFSGKNTRIFMRASPYNLSEKCEELLSELQLTYQEKQAECTLKIPKDLNINVDPLYFEAALRNLMDNAIKYSDAPAEINISAALSEKELVLQVKDSGKGISKKNHRRIFREFYRIHHKTNGHGIGLAFSKQIIKAHKGQIELQSEVGKGSTFCIILPSELVL